MSYALATLWYERQRYLPAILAVGFSALLMALQGGLLVGMFSFASLPVDRARADVWVGSPELTSIDLGRPIRSAHIARLLEQPEVEACETFIEGFSYWLKPDGATELCLIQGLRLGDAALGSPTDLTPDMRDRLTEPGAVIVDDSDLERLGIHGIGDEAQIAGAYVYCSAETARPLLRMTEDQTTYLLARCSEPGSAAKVAARVRETTPLSAFTREDLSRRSRLHWLIKTRAGIALGLAAALGLIVGAVVTSQTLYAATAASLREYAVLYALGIPRWRMALAVLAQSFWVGIIGIALALPLIFVLAPAATPLGVRVKLSGWLLVAAVLITLATALLSGLSGLRPLRRLEPAVLLR